MRYSVLALIVITTVSTLMLIGCNESSIGQPCQFDWPENDSGTATPCTSLPQCHPLLNPSSTTGGVPVAACPLDCIAISSIQCVDLFCVATQVPDDYQQMNGQCTLVDNPSDTQCPKKLSSCMGYCTKECNTDKDCPKDYTCNTTAPYTLPCSDADAVNWGTVCTADCIPSGQQIPGQASGTNCPSDVNICKNDITSNYNTCCLCICSKFCPLLKQKVCRKSTYDAKLFPNGSLSDADFNTLNQCYQQSSQ